jgi:hypothetical protein
MLILFISSSVQCKGHETSAGFPVAEV